MKQNTINMHNMAALSSVRRGDLKNAVIASTPGGIEKQEKEGQMQQAKSQTLPKKLGSHEEAFRALGFVIVHNARHTLNHTHVAAGRTGRIVKRVTTARRSPTQSWLVKFDGGTLGKLDEDSMYFQSDTRGYNQPSCKKWGGANYG